MNIRKPLISALVLAGFMAVGAQASAQSVTVTCTSSATRSTADVEGFNLTSGWYTAVLTSNKGANQVESDRDFADNDDDDGPNDEDVDFEFDSKASEVRDGDTRIARDFIVGNRVTAILRDASGTEVARDSAKCRAR